MTSNYNIAIEEEYYSLLFDPEEDYFEELIEADGIRCQACYGTGMDRLEEVDCMVCWGDGYI